MANLLQFQDTQRIVDEYCFLYPHRELTFEEMKHNAAIIFTVMMNKFNNFNRTAVAAMVGNMQAESTVNPGRWQNDIEGWGGGGGLGLVQWTGWTKYTDWSDGTGIYGWYDGYGQMEWLNTQTVPTQQWGTDGSPYKYTWQQFKSMNVSAGEKAKWFLRNFERPENAASMENFRARLAEEWYQISLDWGWAGLDDIPTKPIEPPVPPVKRKGMPVWMMLRRPF